jgi:hypothetical protein
MTEKPMDEAEARRILENLARNGPPTAQVASIKVLRDMDKDAEAEKEDQATPSGFEGLYEDEFSKRRAASRRPLRTGRGRRARACTRMRSDSRLATMQAGPRAWATAMFGRFGSCGAMRYPLASPFPSRIGSECSPDPEGLAEAVERLRQSARNCASFGR